MKRRTHNPVGRVRTHKTINRRKVLRSRIFPEGSFWRWQIVDVAGTVYMDGGNYRTRAAASSGLRKAFDHR